ncbi:MAG TPA: hypothetical protein H9729_02145, partial [Candidatus Borkfalkia excrementigallinarum]|nr:hypothetical protein [Candidatus Borkfalkia excrementigallinarum]
TSTRGLGGKQSAPPALRRLVATSKKREKTPQKTRERLNGGVALKSDERFLSLSKRFRRVDKGVFL